MHDKGRKIPVADGARKPRSVIQNVGNLFLLGGVYRQV